MELTPDIQKTEQLPEWLTVIAGAPGQPGIEVRIDADVAYPSYLEQLTFFKEELYAEGEDGALCATKYAAELARRCAIFDTIRWCGKGVVYTIVGNKERWALVNLPNGQYGERAEGLGMARAPQVYERLVNARKRAPAE